MKRILLISVLMLLGLAAMAQEQRCPVKITDVRSIGTKVSVLFTNTSQLEISRSEFVVALLDAAGGEHYLPLIESRRRLKDGKNGTASVSAPEAPQIPAGHAKAYVLEVTFADGSGWSDDGAHACSLTAVQE